MYDRSKRVYLYRSNFILSSVMNRFTFRCPYPLRDSVVITARLHRRQTFPTQSICVLFCRTSSSPTLKENLSEDINITAVYHAQIVLGRNNVLKIMFWNVVQSRIRELPAFGW